jgi:hypothetical protein
MEAKIAATRHEFQTQAWAWRSHWKFETVAEHNCWMRQEKSTCLIIALQGRATNVLHGVPKGVTYQETLEALKDHFGDHAFAAEYRSRLKTRTQWVGKSLQEFATAVEHEHLIHGAYPAYLRAA